jgi:hypothetical protein
LGSGAVHAVRPMTKINGSVAFFSGSIVDPVVRGNGIGFVLPNE